MTYCEHNMENSEFMPRKSNSNERFFSYKESVIPGLIKPDSRMKVKNHEHQVFLDCFREEFERKNGVPDAKEPWMHQLSDEGQAALSAEERVRRTAPWIRGLLIALISEKIQARGIDGLPDALLKLFCQTAGGERKELDPQKRSNFEPT